MTAPCTEKTALLLDYTNTAKAYCEAVMELHDKIGSGDRGEYDGLYQIAEQGLKLDTIGHQML